MESKVSKGGKKNSTVTKSSIRADLPPTPPPPPPPKQKQQQPTKLLPNQYSPVPLFLDSASDTVSNAISLNLAEILSLPPYAIPPNATQPLKVEEARVKDLNIQDSYARDKQLSVKEHIQNWRDQCVVVGKQLNPSFTSMADLKPMALQHESWKFYAYCYENQTLGWIAWKPMATDAADVDPDLVNNRIHLELFNASTSIYADEVLVMGRSSKTDSKATQDAAGYFGEGVKVEINRLLSSNTSSSIKYHTSGSMWEFGYSDRGVLLAKISSKPVLPGKEKNSIFPHTWIELHNIPSKTFDPFDYLFMIPPEKIISSKTDPYGKNGKGGVQIILDPVCYGRVYLHGIFVMDTKIPDRKKFLTASSTNVATNPNIAIETITPMCFGWNFCGSTANFQELKIRRDRDDINLTPLMKSMIHLIHDIRQDSDEEVSMIIQSLYETLENLSNTPLKPEFAYWSHAMIFRHNHLYYQVDSQAWKTTARLLLQQFFHIHGQNAIPQSRGGTNWWSAKIIPLTREERDQIQREAELLGVTFIPISEILYEWLSKSDDCPSLEKFWDKRGQEVLLLPEYVSDLTHEILPYPPIILHQLKGKVLFSSEEQGQSIRHIREQICAYFDDIDFMKKVRFKDFNTPTINTISSGMEDVTAIEAVGASGVPHSKVNKIRNTRRMIHLNAIPNVTDCDFYVVDLQLLTDDQVHQALKKLDEDFICPALVFADLLPNTSSSSISSTNPNQSQQKCGCIQNLLIEDILKCWPIDQKSKYDAKFRRRYLSSMHTNLDISLTDFGDEEEHEDDDERRKEKETEKEKEKDRGNDDKVIEEVLPVVPTTMEKEEVEQTNPASEETVSVPEKEEEIKNEEVKVVSESDKKAKDAGEHPNDISPVHTVVVDADVNEKIDADGDDKDQTISTDKREVQITQTSEEDQMDNLASSVDNLAIEIICDDDDDNIVGATDGGTVASVADSEVQANTSHQQTASVATTTATASSAGVSMKQTNLSIATGNSGGNQQQTAAVNKKESTTPQKPPQPQQQQQSTQQPVIKVVGKDNSSSKIVNRSILSTIATVPKSIAQQCKNFSASAPLIESAFVAIARGDSTVVVEGGNVNDDELSCDAISGNFREVIVSKAKFRLPIKIFIHEGSIPEIPDYEALAQSDKMKQFGVLLALLCARVFHHDLAHVAIYLAATNTMAFNRKGNLFFNFLMMDSYTNRHPLEACNLLYSVTCHELAHNMVKEHNDDFASTMGDLVVNFMADFVALTARLKASFTSGGSKSDVSKMWRLIGSMGTGKT